MKGLPPPFRVLKKLLTGGSIYWGTCWPRSLVSSLVLRKEESQRAAVTMALTRFVFAPFLTPAVSLSWPDGFETRSSPKRIFLFNFPQGIRSRGWSEPKGDQSVTNVGTISDNYFLSGETRSCHTWVSVNFSSALNSALSEMDKYCFSLYFFSNALSCDVVKGVLGFLFGLCFRSMQRTGPGGGRKVMSANN